MSKKNLLNESQVRQFMKLASLEPLTPGFVTGLTEKQGAVDKEDEHLGAKDGPERDKKQSEKDRRKEMRGEDRAEDKDPAAVEESHGRGKREGAGGYGSPDQNSRLEEEEDPAELGGDIEHDLGDDSLEGDEEALDDEEEIAGEVEPEGGEGRMVSVDDFLAALESTLEGFLDDEVEVDASDMGAEEPPDEEGFAPEGEEVVADMELDDEDGLEEGVFGGGGEEKWSKIAKGKKDSYAPDPEVGEKDYTPTPEEAAKARAAAKANPTSSRDKFPRHGRSSGGGGMKIGGITAEGQDELIEQVTKRVAARILKSALAKKK